MKVRETTIPGVLVLEPKVFGDERGFFMATYNRDQFHTATGLRPDFLQDNLSRSARGVLRGLHLQLPPHAQGKLVSVVRGKVFDVVVDMRPGSPSFGRWVGEELSEDNRRQLWVPPGMAHGFLVLSDVADMNYKISDSPYTPPAERTLMWNDPAVGIKWPDAGIEPLLSDKDSKGLGLQELLAQLHGAQAVALS